MDKSRKQEEVKKIFTERNQKAEKIIRSAKENGTWKKGLDANNHLFKELDDETKQKLKELADG